jgi:hypothetical protein
VDETVVLVFLQLGESAGNSIFRDAREILEVALYLRLLRAAAVVPSPVLGVRCGTVTLLHLSFFYDSRPLAANEHAVFTFDMNNKSVGLNAVEKENLIGAVAPIVELLRICYHDVINYFHLHDLDYLLYTTVVPAPGS